MEKLTEENILKNQKHNQKLYKFYKMIGWDMLFYYAISFLFLVQVKGLSTSQIIFADAFYPLFKIILQLPCTILIEKIGKRNCLILGNLSIATYVLIVMGLSSIVGFIISNIFCALGFILKEITEANILHDSIENSKNKRNIFSKIDSSGSALYYCVDAVTSIFAGFLFIINPYLPMSLCLICLAISIFLAYNFKEIPITAEEEKEEIPYSNLSVPEQFKYYILDLKQAFKFIFKSDRLRSLILFYALFSTLLTNMTTLRRSLLNEILVPEQYFGILFAIWGIIAALSSKYSTYIQAHHRNHTLGFIGILYTLSVLFAGLAATLIGLPKFITYFICLAAFSLQFSIKGPFYTLINRYLGSFSTSTMRTKISSANLLIENITCTLITFAISYLTDNFSTAFSTLMIGIIFTLILITVLSYMKTRVGLKPEEYKDSDIHFNELY